MASAMRIDTHVHTWPGSLDALHGRDHVIKAAKARGLDAIAITDHDMLCNSRCAKKLSAEYEITIIPGMELTVREDHRHVVILGSDAIPKSKDIYSILDDVHDNNGIAIASHPRTREGYQDFIKYDFDGFECVNGFCTMPQKSRGTKPNDRPYPIGASDAHSAKMLGFIYSEGPCCNSYEEIIEAMGKGEFKPRGHMPKKVLAEFAVEILADTFRNNPQRAPYLAKALGRSIGF